MVGSVGILNVGAGDTKLTFDRKNPAERIRAARIVKDMLRRGYALLVEVKPGHYERALDFNEEHCEYIIADFDGDTARKADDEENHEESVTQPTKETSRGRPRLRKAVPADKARAVAVSRTAGG